MTPFIHPTAIVESGATLGQHVSIGPYCIVGAHVTLGDHVVLHSHNIISGHSTIGAHTQLYPFACLGGTPQDKKYHGETSLLVVGERNIFREYTTVHTGTVANQGLTSIGNDGLFMVAVHVAHDCVIGDHVIMSNQATLGGHVHIGNHVTIGGLSAVHQFVRIGDYAFIGGMSGVTRDVVPYGMAVGNRAMLAGLNLVGLRRHGFTHEEIQSLRDAYRMLFRTNHHDKPFEQRLMDLRNQAPDIKVLNRLLRFFDGDSSRAMCQLQDHFTVDE